MSSNARIVTTVVVIVVVVVLGYLYISRGSQTPAEAPQPATTTNQTQQTQ